MPKYKLRNPAAPDGRQDWAGRTPRWRVHLTVAQIQILQEALRFFNIWARDELVSSEHNTLLERLEDARQKMQTPLVDEVPGGSLFDMTSEELEELGGG